MKIFAPLFLGAALLAPSLAAAQTVTTSLAPLLRAAQSDLAAGSYAAALKETNRASAHGGLTAYDREVIAQLRGSAASGLGQYALAASSFVAVLNGPYVPASERLALIQAVTGLYYHAGDYTQTAVWVHKYVAAGGTDPTTRSLAAQADYNVGDYAGVAKDLKRDGAAASEAELQLGVSAAQKSGDAQGEFEALQTLLRLHPSAPYWNEAIALVATQPSFPDVLTIDVYRLRAATSTLISADDIEDYAERAILDGQPGEALRALNAGFANGALNSQTDGGHAERLRTLATDTAPPPAPLRSPTPLEQAIASGHGFAALPGYAQGQVSDGPGALARLYAIEAHAS